MLFNTLHHFGIGDEIMHLMNTATILFVLMMMSVLIVEIAINPALLHNHTYTPHVMMVGHHRRQQNAHRCYQKTEYVQSFFSHLTAKIHQNWQLCKKNSSIFCIFS